MNSYSYCCDSELCYINAWLCLSLAISVQYLIVTDIERCIHGTKESKAVGRGMGMELGTDPMNSNVM